MHARQSLLSVSVLKGVFFENRDNGVPNCFALSLALSHGERESRAGNHNNGRISVIRFPLSVREGANCRESQQWSDFSYLIPSPRGRGLGRGQKQSTTPDTPRSIRRKFVAWALPTKTGNLIPFAIISANVIRGKAHATVLYKTHAAFRRPFA